MRYYLPLLLLLLCGASWGQTLELPAEVQGDPSTFVVVTAKTDCASLKWLAIDRGLSLIPPSLLRDSKSAVVMSGSPGRYRLLAYGAKGDMATEPVICVVVIGSPLPDPGPGPGPEPPKPEPPKPVPPKPTKLWIIAIEETETARNGRGTYFSSPALLNEILGKGHRWRIADKDVVDAAGKTPADLAPYIRRAKTWPYMAIVDTEGRIHYEGEPPETPTKLIELLQKITK